LRFTKRKKRKKRKKEREKKPVNIKFNKNPSSGK